MWDSINGSLLSPSAGTSSQYINFGSAPGMGYMGTIAAAPMMGMGMGMGMGYPMFPGAFGAGMPYCDTFVPSVNAELSHGMEKKHEGFVSSALKFIGGITVAVLALKVLKGKKVGKVK